jgi:hypothetical protein
LGLGLGLGLTRNKGERSDVDIPFSNKDIVS